MTKTKWISVILCLLLTTMPTSAAETSSDTRTTDDKINDVEDDVEKLLEELQALRTSVATLTTNVNALKPQIAVVMVRPSWRLTSTSDSWAGTATVLGSTITDFPSREHSSTQEIYLTGLTYITLPAGTYLFELQAPRSDSVVCQRTVSVGQTSRAGADNINHFGGPCPKTFALVGNPHGTSFLGQHNDGSFVKTVDTSVRIRFAITPGTTTFTARPLETYVGSVKITKLDD